MGNQLTWAGVLIVASFIGGLFLGKSTKEKKRIGNLTENEEMINPQGDAEELNQNQIVEEQMKEIERLMGQVTVLEGELKDAKSVKAAAPKPDWVPKANPTAVAEDLTNTATSAGVSTEAAPQEAASATTSSNSVSNSVEPAPQPRPKPAAPSVAELEQQLVSGGSNTLQTLASLRWNNLSKTMADVRPKSDELIDKLPAGNFVGTSDLGSYRLRITKNPKTNQAPVYLSISDREICSWEWNEVEQPRFSEQGFALECGDQTLQVYPNQQTGTGYFGTAFAVDTQTSDAKSNHAFELNPQ